MDVASFYTQLVKLMERKVLLLMSTYIGAVSPAENLRVAFCCSLFASIIDNHKLWSLIIVQRR